MSMAPGNSLTSTDMIVTELGCDSPAPHALTISVLSATALKREHGTDGLSRTLRFDSHAEALQILRALRVHQPEPSSYSSSGA